MPLPPPIEVGSGKDSQNTKRPHPNPQKAQAKHKKKPTPELTKKAPPLQRSKPHKLMKCEKGTWRSHVPFSHFGGRGGTGPPTKKTNLSDVPFFVGRAFGPDGRVVRGCFCYAGGF